MTRPALVIQLADETPAGAKVWITAAWVNPRGMAGVACTPVMTGVGYEGAEPIAA